MKRTLLLAAMIALALFTTAWADQIMYFKDSSRPSVKGQITKTADGYEVRHGSGSAAVVIPESEVDRVEELKTPQDEYRDRLAKINPTDPQALYKLADWAIENDLKVEAKELLEKACKIDPTYENARLKLRQLELSMRSSTAPGETSTVRPAEPTAGASGLPTGIRPDMLVSQEDIYRVRLGEIQPGENVSVEFRNKVLDQFIKSMEGQGDFAQAGFVSKFRTMSPGDQAAYMLDRVDPGSPMLQDIIIKSDPKAFITFRARVWPILQGQGGCASAKCHGSVNGAGGMRLFPGSNEKIVYTNFLILRAHDLIDRGSPESSALLEYGLPGNLATKKHPIQISPIYLSREDSKYQVILGWIKSLKRMDKYTVDYKVPGVSENGPASAPADGPAIPAATPPAASTSPAVMPWKAPAGSATPAAPGGMTPNPAMPRGPGPNSTPMPTPMIPPNPTGMPGRN